MIAQAIVIVGATGDLAQRMLFPSLYFLEAEGLLPEDFRIVGASRADLSNEAFAGEVERSVRQRGEGYFDAAVWTRFSRRLSYCVVDADRPATFQNLAAPLKGAREVIFYLSTSPSLYAAISANLRAAEIAKPDSRVIVEKPIGRDLESCQQINDALGHTFDEKAIFRIDHYLGKETVQNLIALRFANALFEPLWNKVSIDHVQITVAETVGVEGRWSYYDDYGALRDMVQNHVLQLLCLVAMEPPASLDPDSVRNEKVKVLRSLRPIEGRDVEKKTVRGQYRAGVAEGASVPGYLDEAGGGPSDTESFVALQVNIDNWRWAGVPFYLRTGKRMPSRSSQIVIQFRDVPHSIFSGDDLIANRLIIRLQPEEEISLTLMNKTPTIEGMELRPVALNLSLTDAFRQQAPRRRIAYERLLYEAIKNNQTLFVRRDEAEAAWTFVDAIIDGWERYSVKPAGYAAGSWGPSGAFALTERNGHSWYD
ncbi:MAG: glucose-6-phosphate dehydrogenase [Caulobacteraceae bacterium]|nr:glucose-6-phosphate dehydrogenase [Caulobacteraceae bacterium]